MGMGTPMAEQVKVTVSPRAAVMDSSGGLVTVGGAWVQKERTYNYLTVLSTSINT